MATQPLSIHLDSMTRYARSAREIAERFYELRRTLVDAEVAGDSFAALPASQEVADAYAQRCADGLAVLGDGERVFSAVDEAFCQMRDNYEAADNTGASIFDGLS